jgi:hypothetical protein
MFKMIWRQVTLGVLLGALSVTVTPANAAAPCLACIKSRDPHRRAWTVTGDSRQPVHSDPATRRPVPRLQRQRDDLRHRRGKALGHGWNGRAGSVAGTKGRLWRERAPAIHRTGDLVSLDCRLNFSKASRIASICAPKPAQSPDLRRSIAWL